MITPIDIVENLFYVYGYCVAASYSWLYKRTIDPFKF